MPNCVYCHSPLQEGAMVCGKCKAPIAPKTDNAEKPKSTIKAVTKKRLLIVGASFLALVVASNLANAVRTSAGLEGGTSGQGPAKVKIQVDKGFVPNFVGFDAFDAYKLAKELGFSADPIGLDGEYIYEFDAPYEDKLPGKSICYQSMLPGETFKEYDDLKLVIDASCAGAKTKMLAGAYATKANVWTPAPAVGDNALDNEVLEGWVVGYGDKYYAENVTIQTNYGEVSLKLAHIEPISDWCQDDAFPDQDMDLPAMQSLRDTIPLYSPVRAVLAAGRLSNEVFMHRLDEGGRLIDGAEPVNSVNELLVKTGYWVPDASGVYESENKVDPLKRKWTITSPEYFEPPELIYLKRLVTAANSLRLVKDSPIGMCVLAEKIYWDENYKDYYADLDSDSNDSSGGLYVGGNGGGGGCYVRGHYRGGNWVNGYYRSC